MVDLTREMAGLMASLGKPPSGRGRVLMFVSAFEGEGASTVAREYARCEAAYAKKPVWLVDAELTRQSQLRTMIDDSARFGLPGPLSRASPDGSAFFNLTPPVRGQDDKPLPESGFLIARPFLERRLWVTRFLRERLPPGGRARLSDQTGYWEALRGHAQTVVVDAPAYARSAAALQLAPQMDGVIMVVSEDGGDVQARLELRDAIEHAGGRLIGMVYNRARHVSKGAAASGGEGRAGGRRGGRIAAL